MSLPARHLPTSKQFSRVASRTRILLVVAGIAFATSGCINPMLTRLPTFGVNHPTSESRAYQQQDPFPDPDIGPDMFSRPRGYERPRTESRKAAEQRLLYGAPNSPEYVPPGYPRGGLNRPAAVY